MLFLGPSETTDLATADNTLRSRESVGELTMRTFAAEELTEKDGGSCSVGHRSATLPTGPINGAGRPADRLNRRRV